MTEPTQSGISRRTLAKGAAWSVPAVAVAAAAPAYAVSGGTITFTGQNCKLPGNSGYPFNDGAIYLMTIKNTTNAAIDIDIITIKRGTATQAGTLVTVVKLTGSNTCCPLGGTFSVEANTAGTYALVTRSWGNSANGTLEVTYSVDGTTQPLATTPPNDLNPMGTNNDSCGNITGSCTRISHDQQRCILSAVGTCPDYAGGCAGTLRGAQAVIDEPKPEAPAEEAEPVILEEIQQPAATEEAPAKADTSAGTPNPTPAPVEPPAPVAAAVETPAPSATPEAPAADA